MNHLVLISAFSAALIGFAPALEAQPLGRVTGNYTFDTSSTVTMSDNEPTMSGIIQADSGETIDTQNNAVVTITHAPRTNRSGTPHYGIYANGGVVRLGQTIIESEAVAGVTGKVTNGLYADSDGSIELDDDSRITAANGGGGGHDL